MLKIVGDINFADGYFDTGIGIGTSIASGNDPFEKLGISSEDYWIGNFECVASSVSNKNGLYARQFRIEPSTLFRFHHLNLYSVANNHVMQHGEMAYIDTLSTIRDLGADFVGDKKQKTVTITHQNKTVGIIAFSQRPDIFTEYPSYWASPEILDIRNEIEEISKCDYKIAFIHWGNEFIDYPYLDQITFAHYLIDMGVDLVVGMHPHILQGMERYKGKCIFYSIGNCLFNMNWEPTKYSIVVTVDLNGDAPMVDYQYIKKGDDMMPEYCTSVPESYSINQLSQAIYHRQENELYYKQVSSRIKAFRRNNFFYFIQNVFKMNSSNVNALLIDFVKRHIR